MLIGYSEENSDPFRSINFGMLDNLVAFFSGFINHNKVFPKEFYEDKANKLIKTIVAALINFNDSDIFKVLKYFFKF